MEYRCCVLGCLKTSSDAVRLHKYAFEPNRCELQEVKIIYSTMF